jgi:hypothetical protein
MDFPISHAQRDGFRVHEKANPADEAGKDYWRAASENFSLEPRNPEQQFWMP